MLRRTLEIEQRSPEWHQLRATSIGGSDAAVLWGVNPYKTERELMQEKIAAIAGDPPSQPNKAMQRGIDIEDRVVEYLRNSGLSAHAGLDALFSACTFCSGGVYQLTDSNKNSLHASIDAEDDEWPCSVYEIKLKGSSQFAKAKEEIPLHEKMQLWHNTYVKHGGQPYEDECPYNMMHVLVHDYDQSIPVDQLELSPETVIIREIDPPPEDWWPRHVELCKSFLERLWKQVENPFELDVIERVQPGQKLVSAEQASAASKLLKEMAGQLKTVEERMEEIIAPQRQAIQAVRNLFATAIKRMEEDIAAIKQSILDFKRENSVQVDGQLIGPKPEWVVTRKTKKVKVEFWSELLQHLLENGNPSEVLQLTKEAEKLVLGGMELPGVKIETIETVVAR